MAVTVNAAGVTFTAGAAISVNEAVYISAANTVVKTTGANELAVGVAMNNAASGEAVSVHLFGPVLKGIAGAAVAAGAALQPNANGKWITRAAGTGTYLIAKTAAAADGDVFEFVVCPGKPA